MTQSCVKTLQLTIGVEVDEFFDEATSMNFQASKIIEEFPGTDSAVGSCEDKTMTELNFVAMGQDRTLRHHKRGDLSRTYILESKWGSEALLSHFLKLVGVVEIPRGSMRLNTREFDIKGLRRMASICGDYAQLIDTLVSLHEEQFQIFIAEALVKRSYDGSSPIDDAGLLGTQCRPAPGLHSGECPSHYRKGHSA